ncbi:MAG: hypothetical protein EOP33_05250 [Rickettsiaceae bacterium]|nr:MAG: hypothetical protein EOP33_05250 [Rickettsiaceae bacterium]
MTEIRRNKIPIISEERLDISQKDCKIEHSKNERDVQAFLKNRELTQPFTIRIPIAAYQSFRRIAFDKNQKMNQILVDLIKKYIDLELK